jgi:hypothetical protein
VPRREAEERRAHSSDVKSRGHSGAPTTTHAAITSAAHWCCSLARFAHGVIVYLPMSLNAGEAFSPLTTPWSPWWRSMWVGGSRDTPKVEGEVAGIYSTRKGPPSWPDG